MNGWLVSFSKVNLIIILCDQITRGFHVFILICFNWQLFRDQLQPDAFFLNILFILNGVHTLRLEDINWENLSPWPMRHFWSLFFQFRTTLECYSNNLLHDNAVNNLDIMSLRFPAFKLWVKNCNLLFSKCVFHFVHTDLWINK